MYTSIFKIILNRRLNIKIKSFMVLVKKIGFNIHSEKLVYSIYFIFKIIFAVGAGVGLFAWSNRCKYFDLIIVSTTLLNVIFKIVDGGIEYKDSFIFPFENLYELSVANKQKIFRTQFFALLSYHIMTDEIQWASILYVLCCVITDKVTIVFFINFILMLLFGYLFANIFIGKYMYTVIMKKISFIRFISYIAASVLIIFITYTIFGKIADFIRNQKIINNQNIKLLLDDNYVKSVFNAYGNKILEALAGISLKLKSLKKIFSGIESILVWAAGILILSQIKIEFITIKDKINKKRFCDLYSRYIKLLKKIVFKKNILVLNLIESIEKYRWSFAKNFFQVALLEYETLTYVVICITAILNTENNILRIQILLCMNLLATVTQASELRDSGYALFSLSGDKEHIKLIKMSLLNKNKIWEYKEVVFRSILIIPYTIIFLINILISIYIRLPLHYFVVLAAIFAACIFVMPIIQLYMIPLVYSDEYLSEVQVGESFVEEEIADKMQEFPRILIVVVPMLVTIFMILIKMSRNILLILAELIYLSISITILYKYMMKIRNRGIDNAIKNIY